VPWRSPGGSLGLKTTCRGPDDTALNRRVKVKCSVVKKRRSVLDLTTELCTDRFRASTTITSAEFRAPVGGGIRVRFTTICSPLLLQIQSETCDARLAAVRRASGASRRVSHGRLTMSPRSDCTIATSSFRSRSPTLNFANVSLKWPVNAFQTSLVISNCAWTDFMSRPG
jgi:hypothetical protein